MIAGVPGLGLSGLFVLLSALALPLARRPTARRVQVARLFTLAVIMTAAVILSWEAIVATVDAIHIGGHAAPVIATMAGNAIWRRPVIVVSVTVMIAVLAMAQALLHLVGVQPTPTPPPVRSARNEAISPRVSESAVRVHQHRRSRVRTGVGRHRAPYRRRRLATSG
ncbi:MAG: hypothetical protein J2P28_04915 [Actinobacteria bacterium]|nr:hypothetical protein [Actinomycetota bacterium]MBO0834848.1 hypothetical protein [Actinomycetota bacterium]